MVATGERFAKIPEAMVKDHTLHHAAFRVYAAICCRANWDHSWRPIYEAAIAEDLDLKRCTIAIHIRTLVDRGYLEIRPRPGCQNEYRIVANPLNGSTGISIEEAPTREAIQRPPLKESTTPLNGSTPPVESLNDPVEPFNTYQILSRVSPDSFQNSSPEVGANALHPASEKTRAKKKLEPIDDGYIAEIVVEFAPLLGGADRVRKIIDRAMNHQALDRAKNKRLRLRHWLEDDLEKYRPQQEQQRGNARPPTGARPTDVAHDDYADFMRRNNAALAAANAERMGAPRAAGSAAEHGVDAGGPGASGGATGPRTSGGVGSAQAATEPGGALAGTAGAGAGTGRAAGDPSSGLLVPWHGRTGPLRDHAESGERDGVVDGDLLRLPRSIRDALARPDCPAELRRYATAGAGG